MAGKTHGSADQLTLAFDAVRGERGLPTSLRPMVAADGGLAFDDDDYFFEPWWPGARAFAFVEESRLRLQTEHLADPLAAFPELRVICEQLEIDGVVLDGTLLVLDHDGRPDAELLRERLAHPESGSGTGAFVASDILWRDGRDLTALPFETRRRQLSTTLRDGDLCVVSRGLRGEGLTLAAAVAAMGLDALSARRLAARWSPGDAADGWLRLSVVETPAAETRPLLVLLQRLPLDD